ncbi:outer membrane beta-barrel protein [Bradyrhizobium manausense]|uniref:outer membrane protein n=1 Tax=Bradyrhizobium manausense TaxID=989370 RepID=UPI0028A0DFCF|nr:outer membrane beta-barrel protein [Bradyrhizobium manausense]
MKNALLVAAAMVLGGVAAADAADLPRPSYVKAPRLEATLYDWTGFYVGVNAGYGVGRNLTSSGFTGTIFNETNRLAPQGGLGGVQAGYNWQAGNFGLGNVVVGVEADIQGADLNDDRCGIFALTNCTATGVRYAQRLGWFGTARGRIGLANGPVLSYVTGGVAYGGVRTSLSETTDSFATSEKRTGWTIGSGVEAALAGNWTGKIEYLYLNLGTQTGAGTLLAAPTNFSSDIREHIFRVGLNYRVGGASYREQPVANWAGFYVGGNVGSAIARNDSTYGVAGTADPGRHELSPKGFIGGAQTGYNWQASNWVFGLEADFQGSTQRDNELCLVWCGIGGVPFLDDVTIDQRMTWLGTARARIGYSVGSSLFYLTGGAAYGNVRTTLVDTSNFGVFASQQVTSSHSRSGYVVGGGLESPANLFGLLGPNWTAKTEYLFVDLGSVTDVHTTIFGATFAHTSHLQEHIFRSGLNYHFNTPVVAKY